MKLYYHVEVTTRLHFWLASRSRWCGLYFLGRGTVSCVGCRGLRLAHAVTGNCLVAVECFLCGCDHLGVGCSFVLFDSVRLWNRLMLNGAGLEIVLEACPRQRHVSVCLFHLTQTRGLSAAALAAASFHSSLPLLSTMPFSGPPRPGRR